MIFVYSLAVLSGILFGVTESINKHIIEKKYSVFAYSLLQNLFNLLFFLVPFLFNPKFPTSYLAYIFLILSSLLWLLGNVFIIKAYKSEDVSNVSILARSSLIVSFLSGIFLLAEPVNIFKIIGIIFVFLGIITIFYERKRVKLSLGFIYPVISGIMAGFAAYFQKLTLQSFTPFTFLVINQFIMIIPPLFSPHTIPDSIKIIHKYSRKILLSRVTAVISIFIFTWSLKMGNISVINTNMETFYLLSTVFIGILILNEKKNIAKKLAGSILCTFGIILLNFF